MAAPPPRSAGDGGAEADSVGYLPEEWAGVPVWIWLAVLTEGALAVVLVGFWQEGALAANPILLGVFALGFVTNPIAVYVGDRLIRRRQAETARDEAAGTGREEASWATKELVRWGFLLGVAGLFWVTGTFEQSPWTQYAFGAIAMVGLVVTGARWHHRRGGEAG